ncbi:LysR family transcriptional regulator [Fertoebacter nigrum]|uniref:LysR family transcriptional regulator n=1 Tax=Fertoeibacter niger TaxID=2656921 RepID=A0A8X8H5A2_9RHOB|nr:LysR family transcriptional regulator [Fertoeibacter niger]NUB45908.1 LysR family transcriptional regulator [Fertoeibacter niger]
MTGLEDMRCFVEVAACGGLNRAAARLGLSKSIVSRRIAALEADLGVRLLARSTRGVVPTEAGQEFRHRCESILADVAEARETVMGKGGDLTGRLRVTAPQVMGLRIVAPVLGELTRQHPRLQIDLVLTDRVVDLIDEGFDLAIRMGEQRGASLIGRKIAPLHAVLVASRDYLERAGTPKTPADLTTHDCIGYSGGGDWQFRHGRRWVAVRPRGQLRTDSGDAIVQWAASGLGIGHVPAFLVQDRLNDGSLVELLADYPSPDYGIYTLRPPGPRTPAKVLLAIDALTARIRRDAGGAT